MICCSTGPTDDSLSHHNPLTMHELNSCRGGRVGCEWSEWDERHRRQSCEGKQSASGATSEFQKERYRPNEISMLNAVLSLPAVARESFQMLRRDPNFFPSCAIASILIVPTSNFSRVTTGTSPILRGASFAPPPQSSGLRSKGIVFFDVCFYRFCLGVVSETTHVPVHLVLRQDTQ